MGWKDVILLDKGELTSGATFHAAGLVGQLRASVNITKMLKYSVELYSRLEEETGQHTGWSRVGGLRIASSKNRMEELRRSAAMAKTFGLPMELISPKEACDLFPVMERKGIVRAAFLPTDGQIDPSGVTYALALRITYVGELGWELHVPMEYALYLYDAIWEAGKSFGLCNVGYRCIESLRLEKGYRYWSADISPEHSPLEAGLDFCVKLNKGDFIGREALIVQKEKGIGRHLCCLTIDSGPSMPVGKEAILDGDRVIGIVTSGGYGHTIKKPIAYGYLPIQYSEPGTRLQIEVAAKRYEATVEKEPLYDPENLKVRS